jgi:hypothetical protein
LTRTHLLLAALLFVVAAAATIVILGFTGVLATIAAFFFLGGLFLSFLFGFVRGKESVREHFDREAHKLRTLLKKAGLTLEGLPPRFQEERDPSGSWTGERIDPRARVIQGNIARFDETHQTGEEAESYIPPPASAAGPRPPREQAVPQRWRPEDLTSDLHDE